MEEKGEPVEKEEGGKEAQAPASDNLDDSRQPLLEEDKPRETGEVKTEFELTDL